VPERAPGELSPGSLALLHVGFLFGVSAVGSLAAALAGRSEQASVGTLLVLFAVAAAAGFLVRRQSTSVAPWLADLLLLTSVGYLFAGSGEAAHVGGLSDSAALLTASLVALPWALLVYAVHRRVWTQVGAVATVVVALQAAFEVRPELPATGAAAYLLVVAAFLAALAFAGVARPERSGYVLSGLVATAGARVLVDEHAVVGAAVALAVVVLVAAGVLRTGNRSLLPVALLSGVVLGPPTLQPLIGTAHAVSLSLVLAGTGAAWLALDLSQRSVRPVQVGGVFAASLAAVVVSVFLLIGHGRHEELVDLAHALAVGGFFAAAATARRRPAAVVSGLLLVVELPDAIAVGGSDGLHGLVSLAALAAVVGISLRLRTWQPRPAAAPDQQDVALSAPGEEWAVVAPYLQVFDTLVALLASSGSALQLVDRAAGRLVVGDPLRPALVVAIWALDGLRTQVRAVGAPHDTARLRGELDEWLGREMPREAAVRG
jgi:hypothetical protein